MESELGKKTGEAGDLKNKFEENQRLYEEAKEELAAVVSR